MKEEIKKLLQEIDDHLKDTKERLNKLREELNDTLTPSTLSHSLVEKKHLL